MAGTPTLPTIREGLVTHFKTFGKGWATRLRLVGPEKAVLVPVQSRTRIEESGRKF